MLLHISTVTIARANKKGNDQIRMILIQAMTPHKLLRVISIIA